MKDQFDDFLKEEIRKVSKEIPDEGFSEKVVRSIPQRIPFYRRRGFIIITFAIISLVIFFKTNALENIFSIINLNYSQHGNLNIEIVNYNQLIFIAMFCLILIIIPIIEIDEEVI